MNGLTRLGSGDIGDQLETKKEVWHWVFERAHEGAVEYFRRYTIPLDMLAHPVPESQPRDTRQKIYDHLTENL